MNPASGQVVFHTADLGIESQHSLTRSGRTVLSLSTGSAFIEQVNGLDYRILVDASLTRQFARSWNGVLGYHRGLDYTGGLGYVLASNTLTSTLNGYLSRAAEIAVTGAFSRGHISVRREDRLDTYSVATQLRYALSRNMALEGNYSYYKYQIGENLALPTILSGEVRRHAATIGLTFWIPVGR